MLLRSRIFQALLGYSKMRIVSGVKKPTPKTQGDVNDDQLLEMVMSKSSSRNDRDSKIRTGYNGLGGHSNHIQNEKKTIWWSVNLFQDSYNSDNSYNTWKEIKR